MRATGDFVIGLEALGRLIRGIWRWRHEALAPPLMVRLSLPFAVM